MDTVWKRLVVLFAAALAAGLAPWPVTPVSTAQAQAEPRLTDPNTEFHRVYVLGNGDAHFLWHEDNGFLDDLDELKGDLETANNQAAGSTSKTFIKPTKGELTDFLNDLKTKVESYEEVTFYFKGHGSNRLFPDASGEEPDNFDESIRINGTPERITDDELATMLSGFAPRVTLVVILDTCYGGGFTGGTSDIKESNRVAVIGTSGTCPIDPPGIFGGFISTLTEDTADGAGEHAADANGDGKVTAEELRSWLQGRNWDLGPAETDPDKIKSGKSGCDEGNCELPPPQTQIPRRGAPGGQIRIAGQQFAPSATVDVRLIKPDLTAIRIGGAQTNPSGSFRTTVNVPSLPPDVYLIFVVDTDGNNDFELFQLR